MSRLQTLLGALCALTLFITPQTALAVPAETVPSADLTGDNDVNSADFQCLIRLNTAIQTVGGPTQDHCDSDADCGATQFCDLAFGKKLCLPDCLADRSVVGDNSVIPNCFEQGDNDACFVGIPRHNADLNCDRVINNADFQILVAIVLQKLGGPGTPDIDNDGILNFCDNDTDGDGDPDETDCKPNDPEIHADADEVCDGIDNNCDQLVDAQDPKLITVPCALEEGVCQGISTTQCVDGEWLECQPIEYELWSEDYEKTESLCDGIDNDCDGLTDAQDPDLTSDCSCGDALCNDGENCSSCALDCGDCVIECGDGVCTGAEDCLNCTEDCGPPLPDDTCDSTTCDDGTCGPTENCTSCSEDCGACPDVCGNGICAPSETCETCDADCGDCVIDCGDGVCIGTEDCESCPADCGPVLADDTCDSTLCGDDTCGDAESCLTCDKDCGECPEPCGNGVCAPSETCVSCAKDCGECVVDCGDGVCVGTEDCLNCTEDCGPVLPDGTCDSTVCDDGTCGPDESCEDCAGDCGACPEPCGNGICAPSENCVSCDADCGDCVVDCGDGVCVGTEDCESCPADCGPALPDDTCDSTECGDGTCGATESCLSCSDDCGFCPDVCGNGVCAPSESCADCEADCGICYVGCGDGLCSSAEDCTTCTADCGPALPDDTCDSVECGDGTCGATEDCESCSGDCGFCPDPCGNGVCAPGETCGSCDADCGDCPEPCGNGLCLGDETCATCPADCGDPLSVSDQGCCAPSGAIGGCEDHECSACVCAYNPACCVGADALWSAECVALANGIACSETCGCEDCEGTDPSCGDGVCQAGEDPLSCPEDCGDIPEDPCGDGICDAEAGDNCVICPEDCGPCPDACGDAICQAGETCLDCKEDCGAPDASGECVGDGVCGDGVCTHAAAGGTESCASCPGDCGICTPVCDDGQCTGSETCASCPGDCGTCGGGDCDVTPCDGCGDDLCQASESCLTCAADCGNPLADGTCTGPDGEEGCGDGTCSNANVGGTESCETCAQDCGLCEGPCGDGVCTGDESCETCEQDCGGPVGCGGCDDDDCPVPCGDGVCVPGESCATCPGDCGVCVTGCGSGLECGDGACSEGEDCGCCPADCGLCPADGYCGDSSCQIDEDCISCPNDCGSAPLLPTAADDACCAEQPGMGCGDFGCSQCVCDVMPECCGAGVFEGALSFAWTDACAELATGQCAMDCPCVDTSCGDADCGDAICQVGEQASCPEDCGDDEFGSCDDSVCQSPKENCFNCPQDCQACSSDYCGNFFCGPAEDCDSCPEDCGTSPFPDGGCDVGEDGFCGDALCSADEDCTSCPEDCGACLPLCGDSVCHGGETCFSCPGDCGPCIPPGCGDLECGDDENCYNCSQDCGICDPLEDCGDGLCDSFEDCKSCAPDCGICPCDEPSCASTCGDQLCGPAESCESCSEDCGDCPTDGCVVDGLCAADETCLSCPADCGEPADDGSCDGSVKTCGDGTCAGAETCDNCGSDCGDCPAVCGDDLCEPSADETCATCPADCGTGGPGAGTCCKDNGSEECLDGACLECVCVLRPECCLNPAFNNAQPNSWSAECAAFAQGAPCAGACHCVDCGDDDAQCGDNTCSGSEDCESCPGDCGTCPPKCGDSVCSAGESCQSCPGDCGGCDPVCGDSSCVGIENCFNCPDDCGAPINGSCEPDGGPVCGDGLCSPAEDCSCPADCGPCLTDVCGDGACNGSEDCESCEGDCGACDYLCGDGICEIIESCLTCPADCGDPIAPEECDGDTPTCGDGTCNGEEDCGTCIQDCGNCTGVSVCDDGVCDDDEDCQSCALDCGACPCAVDDSCPPACGDGTCDSIEDCSSCSVDCGECALGCFPGGNTTPCAPVIETEDGETIVIAPDCSGACVGASVDAAACALDACFPQYVLSASYNSPTGAPVGSGMRAITQYGDPWNDLAPIAGPSYLSLGSGDIQTLNTNDAFSNSGVTDPYSNDPYQSYDVVEFTLEMIAPEGVTGFSFDYIFMSAEYEEYIGSQFNDRFYAILNAPTTTGGQDEVINYAPCSNPNSYVDFTDDKGSWCYIAINTAFSEPCSNPSTDIAGTAYACPPAGGGSSTGWLTTTYPIEEGETFSLTFHVHDTSDAIFDSHALIDNFRWRDGDITGGTGFLEPCEDEEDGAGEGASPACGDGACSEGEHCGCCAADCGVCPDVCGDGTCGVSEDCFTCPNDCGDAVYYQGEPVADGLDSDCCTTDEADGPGCDNGTCTECLCAVEPACCSVKDPAIPNSGWTEPCGQLAIFGECAGLCDCGTMTCGDENPICSDGICNGDETCASCEDDCGPCVTPPCGDDQCTAGENCGSCPQDCGDCPIKCGDGTCQPWESCSDCPEDCGEPLPDTTCGGDDPSCGDGICTTPTELCSTCAEDCGPCLDVCGDGFCGDSEGCTGCPDDCGACYEDCGNGLCDGDETCLACPDDCGNAIDDVCDGPCGNGACGPDETPQSCPEDCGGDWECGDGTCDPSETCSDCGADCGECPDCGDGACALFEDCLTCPSDCGQALGDGTCGTECGDGACSAEESAESCPEDCGDGGPTCGNAQCDAPLESCANCALDCGVCPGDCGDGVCQADEDCGDCPDDCVSLEVSGVEPPCETGECGDGICQGDEDCLSCGQDCGYCVGYICGAGGCQPELGENCVNCPVDCGVCSDDCDTPPCPQCGDGACSGGESCQSCPVDCGSPCPLSCGDDVCTGSEDCFTCSEDCGDAVEGFLGPGGEMVMVCDSLVCGDGLCGVNTESCTSCSADCGTCPTICGNFVCEQGEGCENCLLDCGDPCTPECGDDVCAPEEDCLSCADDCGNGFLNAQGLKQCEPLDGDPACEDGTCNGDETCESCPADCGACPVICGDGACTGDENCHSCDADCGCSNNVDSCWDQICTTDGLCLVDEDAGIDCDDQDPCTVDACDMPTALCTHTPIDGCDSAAIACALSGEAGDWVSCPLNYARATTIKPPAVAADILFTFDASMVMAKELSACTPMPNIGPAACTPGDGGDSYCSGTFGVNFICDISLGRCAECSSVSTEDSLTLASSHTAATCDTGAGDCDAGEMLLFLYSFSSAPLTDSYLDSDAATLINDPYLLDMRFQLAQSGTLIISYDHAESTFSDNLGQEMVYTFEHNQGIATNPDNWFQTNDVKVIDPLEACEEECDDFNPCTDDSCDVDLVCTHAPNTVECDDDDPMTVGDVCVDSACVGSPINDLCVCADDAAPTAPAEGTACHIDVSGCDLSNFEDGWVVGNTIKDGELMCMPALGPDAGPTTVCMVNHPVTLTSAFWPMDASGQTAPDGALCGQVLSVCNGSLDLCNDIEAPSCDTPVDCVVGTAVCGDLGWSCEEEPAIDGTPCDDGDPETSGDVCSDNVCAGTPSDTGWNHCACDEPLWPYAPVAGEPCTVDLSGCDESQKANSWKGLDSAEGVMGCGQYGASISNAVQPGCTVSDGFNAGWPVDRSDNPQWWCGEVISSCGDWSLSGPQAEPCEGLEVPACDSANACTIGSAVCIDGAYLCEETPVEEGTPCEDGDGGTVNETCNGAGTCVAGCTIDCSDKSCGSDGCGGDCGTCTDGDCIDGQCVCLPACSGIECGGDNGCGADCGTCSGAQDACVDGQCVCQPACTGKVCGDNGCGGDCGTCTGQDTCVDAQCVCQPACDGKVCGDDGCDGECGTCAVNETCEEDGQVCSCQPDCTGKVCGGDGCGGECGSCASDLACTADQQSCVCYEPICPPLNTVDGLIEGAEAGDSYCVSDTDYQQCVDPGNGQCPEWDWEMMCNWNDGVCIQYGSNHDCALF